MKITSYLHDVMADNNNNPEGVFEVAAKHFNMSVSEVKKAFHEENPDLMERLDKEKKERIAKYAQEWEPFTPTNPLKYWTLNEFYDKLLELHNSAEANGRNHYHDKVKFINKETHKEYKIDSFGFSYRGYYNRLAFELAEVGQEPEKYQKMYRGEMATFVDTFTTVAITLGYVKGSLITQTGWKGGEYLPEQSEPIHFPTDEGLADGQVLVGFERLDDSTVAFYVEKNREFDND